MRPALAAVAALLLAALPAQARAVERLALLPATGANVGPPELAAATDVLRSHLEATGRFEVLRATSLAAPGEEPTPVQAAAAARSVGADAGLVLRVSRLSGRATVRLAAYRALDGARLHVDEIGALGADDLDPALQRIARGLALGRPARQVAEVDTVTERETQPRLRKPTVSTVGYRIGGMALVNRPVPGERTGLVSGMGILWTYDADGWLADLSLDFATSDLDWSSNPDRLLAFGASVFRPLTRGDNSLYVGGGAALTASRLGGPQGGSGLQLRATAGWLAGRLSDASFRVEGTLFYDTYAETERGTGRDVRVGGLWLSLIVTPSK